MAYDGELVEARVAADLAPYIARACGYVERSDDLLVRREVPISRSVLILGLGEPIGVGFPEHGSVRRVDGFVAGFSDTYALSTTHGRAAGIQLELTPRGAYALLGPPPDELANRVLAMDELEEPWWQRLQGRVAEIDGWARRLGVVAAAIRQRLADGPELASDVAWGWEQIHASGGRRPVHELARELGWSRRHFGVRFRQHLGLSPKTMARVVRFERAYGIAQSTPDQRWSDIAHACGYADQSHLVRDFRDLAGAAPTTLMAEQAGDRVPFVQDQLVSVGA